MRPVFQMLLLAAALAAPAAAQVNVSKMIVEPYLRIQTSLVADDLEGVNAEAARIATAARRVGPNANALGTAAGQLASAEDIDQAREAFGKVSDALIAYAKADETTEFGEDLHVAYCPMVKKSWIQRGTEIANPYGGQKMPTCGEIKGSLK